MWLSTIKTAVTTIAAVVSFLKWLGDALQSRADRAAGRAESEAAQAKEGVRVQQEIATEAAKPLEEDDAIDRLGKGDA